VSAAAHTPGPWTVCAGDASYVSVGLAKPINCGNKANARLIAAAPKMYEALAACHKTLSRSMFSEVHAAVIEQASAALAAAVRSE
jgi:hypothetical protein